MFDDLEDDFDVVQFHNETGTDFEWEGDND